MDKKYSILERMFINKIEEQQKQIDLLIGKVKFLEVKLNEVYIKVEKMEDELKSKVFINQDYFS